MVLVHDHVASAQLGERAQRSPARSCAPAVRAAIGATALGPSAAQQPVLGKDG